MKGIRIALTAALLGAIAVPAVAPAVRPDDRPFDRVVVFGDSLSDGGNRFILTGEQSRAPFLPIPGAPYTLGGHHFSNGATWVELLAKSLNDPLGGKPSLRRSRGNANYAYGGARATGGVWPDLATQIASYLDDNGTADADALHVIWFGGNDVREALALLQQDDIAGAIATLAGAVNAIGTGVADLYFAGAHSFLIANVPNLSILPAVQAQGAAARFWAGVMSAEFNAGLDAALGTLEGLPGISITRFDVETLLSAVYSNPEAYGLEDSMTPCLRFGVIADAICAQPEGHLFWDGVHPTTRAHRILADSAYGLLTSP